MDINLLPPKIIKENEDLKNNKVVIEKIKSENFSKISTTIERDVYVDNNSSATANIFFFKGIKNTYSSSDLAASSIVTFSNFLNITSSSTISSIYEHIRSYVYRPLNWQTYIASNRGPYITSSSTTGLPTLPSISGALTGIRTIVFNKKIVNDSIKRNTLRIAISPVNVNLFFRGLNFSNNTGTNSSSGQYASITGQQGLSGSLSSGILGKAVTAFTIGIRFKPKNAGPENQTLLHRRIADKSLSSLNYAVTPGVNSSIITTKYIDLNPLSAVTNFTEKIQTFTFNQWNTSSEPLTSIVVNLTNKGGGQLFWSASAQNLNADGINWLSLSSALTAGTIHSYSNTSSATASITAIVAKSITGYALGTQQTSNIVIYNSSTSEVCYNLPLIIPIKITTQESVAS